MRKRHDYTAGYQDGYKAGSKLSTRTLEGDVAAIYGMMGVVLSEEYGWNEDELVGLIERIQKRWNEKTQSDELLTDYINERCPIEFVQMCK